MSDNYIQPLCALMSFLDNKEYKMIDDDVFTQARLLEIRDIDIYWYLTIDTNNLTQQKQQHVR